MKKMTNDIVKAFDSCVEALSLNELSRRTGVGLYTLRKFATRQTNSIREETWDKLYPHLKPYLIGDGEGIQEPPPRIGPTARRHLDLVDLVSDQKVLLDAWDALNARDRADVLEKLRRRAPNAHPFSLGSLTSDENLLLGCFADLPEDEQEPFVIGVAELATFEMRKQRRELF